jgi:hypothetical protein
MYIADETALSNTADRVLRNRHEPDLSRRQEQCVHGVTTVDMKLWSAFCSRLPRSGARKDETCRVMKVECTISIACFCFLLDIA